MTRTQWFWRSTLKVVARGFLLISEAADAVHNRLNVCMDCGRSQYYGKPCVK